MRNRNWKNAWRVAAWFLLLCPASLTAQSASSSWPVRASGEKLEYNLSWPSGISLGEATLQLSHTGSQFFIEARVDADLPQYHVVYTFNSITDEQFCSVRFRQTLREGKRSTDDTTDFDQKKHEFRRTRGGKATTGAIPECARDPLALLYYFREQLALGKVATGTPEASGAFFLGQDFSVHYDAVAAESTAPKAAQGDRFLLRLDGAPEAPNIEIWVRPDSQRAPVAARVAFSLGTLSAELH